MKKWLFRVIWIPVLLVAVLFLIANRQLVAVSLDPFNAEAPALTTPALPLWSWLMVMLFVGLGAGPSARGFPRAPNALPARADHKLVKHLRREITALETRLREAEAARDEPRASVTTSEPAVLEAKMHNLLLP